MFSIATVTRKPTYATYAGPWLVVYMPNLAGGGTLFVIIHASWTRGPGKNERKCTTQCTGGGSVLGSAVCSEHDDCCVSEEEGRDGNHATRQTKQNLMASRHQRGESPPRKARAGGTRASWSLSRFLAGN